MKILLLGANGQLGSDILRANAVLNQPNEIASWTRAQLDVSDYKTISETLSQQDFDVLVNCTSYHNTEQVEANAALAFNINAFAVREMARVCQNKNARFIHISTDYVFGGTLIRRPLTEADCPAPLNVYGASKLMGEALATTIYQNTTILRVASLFGISGASGKGGNFIESILKAGREKGKLRVVSDQMMTPTATADIAKMLLTYLKKNGAPGIYHTVNSGHASWYELAAKAVELAGVSATVEPISASEYPLVAMRPPYSVLDNSKLANLIGPIRDWQAALKDYLVSKGHMTLGQVNQVD